MPADVVWLDGACHGRLFSCFGSYEKRRPWQAPSSHRFDPRL